MSLTVSKRGDRVVLANGIVILVSENVTADIIAARCFFAGGQLAETTATAGMANLATSLMTRGTARYSSLEIAEQVESIGASLGTDSSSDYCVLSMKTITSDFHDMLLLGAEILRSPSFPASELDLERKLTIQSIRSQQERPFTIAYDQLQKLIYGDHPYGLSSLGTEASVSAITREDLVRFHQQHFRPDQMVVSIAGKITTAQAVAIVGEAFGDWQVVPSAPIPAPPTPKFQPSLVTHEQDAQQAIVMIGYPAPSVSSPDYAALKIISTYLGNGLSSRLFVELREKRGLAYEVSAFYPTRLEASQFVAYMGTASQNAKVALDGLRYECERLAETSLTESELEVCKSKMLGQYSLGKQTNGQIAQVYGWYEVMGLGLEFDRQFVEAIAGVTLADVQRVARRYLVNPAISVVGSAEALAQIS